MKKIFFYSFNLTLASIMVLFFGAEAKKKLVTLAASPNFENPLNLLQTKMENSAAYGFEPIMTFSLPTKEISGKAPILLAEINKDKDEKSDKRKKGESLNTGDPCLLQPRLPVCKKKLV